jgi:hypothetical protein
MEVEDIAVVDCKDIDYTVFFLEHPMRYHHFEPMNIKEIKSNKLISH